MPFTAGFLGLIRLEMLGANLGIVADAEIGYFAVLAGISDEVNLVVIVAMQKLELQRIALPPDDFLGDVVIVGADADAERGGRRF